MKFVIEKKRLLETLIPAQAVIPLRTTLPILQNLKMSAETGKLKVEATDLDVSISKTALCEIDTEGALLVPAKRLYDIVRELPDLEIHIEQTDLILTLRCGYSVFKLPGIDIEDYPKIPAPPLDSGNFVKLGISSLLRALDKVSFAISTDESRPALCGLLWQIFSSAQHSSNKEPEEEMRLVATDGHRLAFISTVFTSSSAQHSVKKAETRELDPETSGKNTEKGFSDAQHSSNSQSSSEESSISNNPSDPMTEQAIVPQKALHLLDLLLKPYRDSDSEIDLYFGESVVDFIFSPAQHSSRNDPAEKKKNSGELVHLSSRLISGIFPDYNSVLPRDNDKIVRVRKDDFIGAVRRVSVFSDPYTHLVKFSVGSDSQKIRLSASSPQGGEAYDEVECRYQGEELDIGYNAAYLLEILKRIDTAEIEIQLKSPVDAGIFLPTEQEENEKILYLLMPIRLS